MIILTSARTLLTTTFILLSIISYSQNGVKETYRLLTKEKEKYFFAIKTSAEKPTSPTDSLKIKVSCSLLAENEEEKANENTYIFSFTYTKPRVIKVVQILPDNIIGKLAINSSKFPPNYETFCKEKMIKNMNNIFRQIESDNKLKKIGAFE